MSRAAPVTPPDPSGRLDLLVLRSVELLARKVESKIGIPIWTPDLASAVTELIDECGVPAGAIDVKGAIGNELAEVIRSHLPERPHPVKRSARRRHVR